MIARFAHLFEKPDMNFVFCLHPPFINVVKTLSGIKIDSLYLYEQTLQKPLY